MRRPYKGPPPIQPGQPENRQMYRREDDEEQRDVVDYAVQSVPVVRRLLNTGKVAGAVGAIFAFIGGAGAALGYGMVGPTQKIEELSKKVSAQEIVHAALDQRQAARIDSLLSAITIMQQDVATNTFIQCVQLRRRDPDLMPSSCADTERRGRTVRKE